MVHEDMVNFVGGFRLGAEAQAFYQWLGDYIRHHGGPFHRVDPRLVQARRASCRRGAPLVPTRCAVPSV